MLCGAYMPPDTGSRPRANIAAGMIAERLPKTNLRVEDGPARRKPVQTVTRQHRDKAGPGKTSGGTITRSDETKNGSDPTELEPVSQPNSPTKESASQTEEEEDILNTPEHSPREGQADHPREMDVPVELGMQKLSHASNDGGASLPKAPMHTHWRHRWQHHHGVPEPAPPPIEEDEMHKDRKEGAAEMSPSWSAAAHPSSSSRSATAHVPTPKEAHHSHNPFSAVSAAAQSVNKHMPHLHLHKSSSDAGETSSAHKADTKAPLEDTEIDTPPPSEPGHSPADPVNSTSKQQATIKLEKRDAG